MFSACYSMRKGVKKCHKTENKNMLQLLKWGSKCAEKFLCADERWKNLKATGWRKNFLPGAVFHFIVSRTTWKRSVRNGWRNIKTNKRNVVKIMTTTAVDSASAFHPTRISINFSRTSNQHGVTAWSRWDRKSDPDQRQSTSDLHNLSNLKFHVFALLSTEGRSIQAPVTAFGWGKQIKVE